jgi:phosphoribosyl 1,2-cyclic phosphodiesterase
MESSDPLEVCVLASSSSGNSVAVRFGRRVILMDAGLSAKAIEKRLDEIGWAAEELCGILVSHEHLDHARGASVLGRRYGVPIFGTQGTLEALAKLWRGEEQLVPIENGYPFQVETFLCEPFSIPHDVADPTMFVVRCGGAAAGMATDLGRVTELVRQKLTSTNIAIIEANHDPDRLRWGDYPWAVKQRISSPHGHLGNEQAAELAVELVRAGVEHIVCGHLSPHHNDAEEVARVVGTALLEADLMARVTVVAPKQGTEVFTIPTGESIG